MQTLKFSKFQEEQLNSLYDENGRELQQLSVHVVDEEGFNYSTIDNCFVNQKKNHFQVSVYVEASDAMPPKFVFYNGELVPIRNFKLAFCGVKAEMPTSEVCIRQSRADRKPHPHTPVLFEIQERRMTKITVPRLHFSETTLNNQRRFFPPNPEQKYFLLVVRLFANISDDVSILIESYASEKIIVRATNPGSFEPPDFADLQAGRLNVDSAIHPNNMHTLKFANFQEDQWNSLYDENDKQLHQLSIHVVAEEGFNYSTNDNCFWNLKKNHFQVAVHVEASDPMPPKFVLYNGELAPIRNFKLAFCGVKAEMPSSEVCIRQSRVDRRPIPHMPVLFEIQERSMTKLTVPRLHFSETTLNNQRRNFRPNPEQKYFLLVVRLFANISDDVSILIESYASEKVIVRATNPGIFETSDIADLQAGRLNVDSAIHLNRVQSNSTIKFWKFQEEQWNSLYDQNGKKLQQLSVYIAIEKGFNYSMIDNCFWNQKKNHFQVSFDVEASDPMPPKFVFHNGELMPIRDFKLDFCGVKAEMPTSEVCIRQSRVDQKPQPFTPVLFEIQERRMTTLTVPRLHFSETTLNNQRRNHLQHPDQKYFRLVVRLFANISDDVSILIQSYASDKIIVRATNPGPFEILDADVAHHTYTR